jgi:hypothetical protein
VQTFKGGIPDPWSFVAAHPQDDLHAGKYYGTFSSEVLRAHPGFVIRGAYETFLTSTSWDQQPADLAAPSATPTWFAAVSRLVSLVYGGLPLLFIASLLAAWRNPHSMRTIALATLMLLIVAHISSGAFADFESYDRLRMPVDWAMLLVTVVVIAQMFGLDRPKTGVASAGLSG